MKRLKLFEIPDGYCRLFMFQQNFGKNYYQAMMLFDREGLGSANRCAGSLTPKELAKAECNWLDWSRAVIESVREELGV